MLSIFSHRVLPLVWYLRHVHISRQMKTETQDKNNLQNTVKSVIRRYRKASYEIQHPFIIKPLNKLGKQGSYLNTIKATCEKLTGTLH